MNESLESLVDRLSHESQENHEHKISLTFYESVDGTAIKTQIFEASSDRGRKILEDIWAQIQGKFK